MNYKNILALDPSGNFKEGKGTTGFCLLKATEKDSFKAIQQSFSLCAKDYNSAEEYWIAHLNILKRLVNKQTVVVIEDYRLYASKANSQINSTMETPKLIGIIQVWCMQNNVPYHMQLASEVKSRWSDKILKYKGYIKEASNKRCYCNAGTVNRHQKDAVRHAVHFKTFRNGK